MNPTKLKLTQEQLDAISNAASYLKSNKEVLDPISWKRKAIKWNYAVTAIPVVWGLGSSFGINIHLSASQAEMVLQTALFAVPLAHNVVLAISSKKLSLNPFYKEKKSLNSGYMGPY